ncbi:hypothetical protein BJ878DRAFT_475986 [Calycina marina]|uniref:Developmental regulatory protein wetA n=1 Tax=Calycina marina TaxID=1763456 RepID=A0A9P7ZBC7_9HELO|nr:hypothetical protein BJ878DRAFT_475986 [Calycina marina]
MSFHAPHSNSGHHEDLTADFFEQFLDFSPAQNDNATERHIGSSSSDNATSSTPGMSLDWPGESWMFDEDSTTLSTAGHNFYFDTTGRAAISDSELLNLEGISLESPKIEPRTSCSLPASPSLTTTTRSKKHRVVEAISKKMKSSMSSFERALRSPIPKTSPKTTRRKSLALEEKVETLKFEFDFERSPAGGIARSKETTAKGIDLSFETPLSAPQLDASSRKTSSQRRSCDGLPTTPNHDHTGRWPSVSFSTDMNSHVGSEADASIWWNHVCTVPMAQPSPTVLHINPQRATKSLAYQLQNDLARSSNERNFTTAIIPPSGLMAQVPYSSSKSFVVESSPRQQHPRNHFGPTHRNYQARPNPNGHYSRTRLPGYYPPQSYRGAPSTSESESPSLKLYSVRKRQTPRKERSSAPRTPSLGAAVDFVNFTPSDSKKILTAVAPSGSSKTRARREKEAMEKRRKFSQAVVNAVRAAGGNVENLVAQGLLY